MQGLFSKIVAIGVRWLLVSNKVPVFSNNVFSGSAQSSLNDVERYDPRTNTWAPVSPMVKKRSLLNVAVLDGKYPVKNYLEIFMHWLIQGFHLYSKEAQIGH